MSQLKSFIHDALARIGAMVLFIGAALRTAHFPYPKRLLAHDHFPTSLSLFLSDSRKLAREHGRACETALPILAFALLVHCLLYPAAIAQIPSVSNITSTPIMGVGHNYLEDLNEIVNPANGSVSIRIASPTPHERGLNFPVYAYTYDSNGQVLVSFGASANGSACNVGDAAMGGGPGTCTVRVDGPGLALPQPFPHRPDSVFSRSYSLSEKATQTGSTTNCSYQSDFIYTDPEGGRHNLAIYWPFDDTCRNWNGYAVPEGGDEHYKVENYGTVVSDAHGNILGGSRLSEDTNGNYRNGTGRPWSTVYNANYDPTSMTVPGYSTPYTYDYGSATSSFRVTATLLNDPAWNGPNTYCYNDPSPSTLTLTVLKTLHLPTGDTYQFTYDPIYGFVNKIVYPTGATVTYTWGMNSGSEPGGAISGKSVAFYGPTASCYYKHDWPAVAKRVVSFDGSTPGLEQDFSYTTTWPANGHYWTSKTTTVTTIDLLRVGHPSTKTIYTYGFQYESQQNTITTEPVHEVPVEDTIAYQDEQGNTIKTIKKIWNTPDQLAAQCEILPNGNVSGTFYQYRPYNWGGNVTMGAGSTSTDQMADVTEYDYGTLNSSCQQPSTTPTRETKTQYASFANSTTWPVGDYILDRPQSVMVYDHGTLSSETDYVYDKGTAAIASVLPAAIGHDTNYAASSTLPRGNATTVTRQCFSVAVGCANSITTANYDETGMPVSVTDARGNTTYYSFTDNFTTDDGSPPGNTNTYLTQVTRPTTNGTTHSESFQWDYNKGELRQLTDENSQKTLFRYDDGWNRPTSSIAPDGGSIGIAYNDKGPAPTRTTTKLINSAGIKDISVVTMDGFGHQRYVERSSYPGGAITTETKYDGLGRVQSVSNPYLSTAGPTDVTTYSYDALGRTVIQTQPDSSLLQWCYNGLVSNKAQTLCNKNVSAAQNASWVDVSDETGRHWQRVNDGFGRLVAAIEPDPVTNTLGLETDYGYDALDNLLSVTQKGSSGSSARSRTFTYDSLSRLICASNPENSTAACPLGTAKNIPAGTISYLHDPNGNVSSKTDGRGSTTSYGYDTLNRLISKTYPADTASSCYQYDLSPLVSGGGNLVGHLTNSWTQKGLCPSPSSSPSFSGNTAILSRHSILAYDAMGRVLSEQQCTYSNCSTSKSYAPAYTYDLAGNVITHSNGIGTMTLTNCYDAAGHLSSVANGSFNCGSTPPVSSLLFSSPTYSPAGGLTGARYGTGLLLQRTYDSRLRVTSETDTGNVVSNPTPGTAIISISGTDHTQ